MTAAYVEDTDRLGLGRPDPEPKASETIEPIVALIEDLVESGHAYEAGGDVYFSVASFAGLRQALQPPARRDAAGRGRRRRRAQARAAGLRALEGHQGGRGHQLALALGRRGARAGTSSAPRWPSSSSASTSRSTAAARTSCSPTTRTRSPRPRPRAASRWPGSGCTTAWSRWAPRRWPSPWATSTCCTARSTSTAATRSSMWLVSGHYRQPIGFSDDALDQAGGRVAHAARAGPPARRRGAAPADGLDPLVERFFDALADDFNTPAARAVLFEWVTRGQPPARRRRARSGPGGCARCCTRWGWRRLLDGADDEAPDDVGSSPTGARPRAPRATSPRRTGCATSWPSAAGRSATPPTARGSCAPRVIVYGRNPVREALRGPRRVERIWATEQRGRREPWLRGRGGARDRGGRDRGAAAARPSTRASAPRSADYRYADPGRPARGRRRARALPRRGPGPAQPRRGLPRGRDAPAAPAS